MKRYLVVVALALVAGITQFSFPSASQADTALSSLILLQTVPPTLMVEAQADATAQPTVHQSTWGALKVIYRGDRVGTSNNATQDSTSQTRVVKPGATLNAVSVYWGNNVLSEAFYALTKYRTGSSNCVYQGMAMSDWVQVSGYTYPRSDNGALSRVTSLIGSANRGSIDGQWNGCPSLGGYCKFFVDLVLYRSSYGYPGGHLFLPSGYAYAPYGWRSAQAGWVVQAPWLSATQPAHSAIVVLNNGGSLDVIDSNWVGTTTSTNNFVIARHTISASTLDARGFKAYCPWQNPSLVQ